MSPSFWIIPVTRWSRPLPSFSESDDGTRQFALLLLRGDHNLNEIKAQKIAGLAPFRFAADGEIVEYLGCSPGYIGPVGVDGRKCRSSPIARSPP